MQPKLTGMSRTRPYEELKSGRLVAKTVGRSTLIPLESIEAWLQNLETYPESKQNQNSDRFVQARIHPRRSPFQRAKAPALH